MDRLELQPQAAPHSNLNCREAALMITKAFILGAGLGTRLRPLTDVLPKPLVPVFHEPMANFALRLCQAAGIKEFAINTHHIPEAWSAAYPDGSFHGSPLSFFHEPVLLETGGGIRNIGSFIGDDPILVYNGDILTDIDIGKLIAHHQTSGNIATLALRFIRAKLQRQHRGRPGHRYAQPTRRRPRHPSIHRHLLHRA